MGRRRSDGTSSDRSPAKLSDVTTPHATNSANPSSTSVRSDLEAVEQVEHCREPLGSLGARPFRRPLPAQQKPQEVGGGDRLDLFAQPVEGVTMDARQQATLAPLQLLTARREAAAQHKPLVLQRAESEIDVGRFQTEGSRQL